MIVKVCGVTDPAIAEVAVEAGADWIGIVLVPASPRHADDAAARRVVEAVAGRADVIGVLVSPSAEVCDQAALRYRLAAVQVHGDVDASLAARCAVPVIRAINPRSPTEAFTFDWWPDGLVHLDGSAEDRNALPGGTGRPVPLEWAAEVGRHRPVILAGGLNPENVATAIEAAAPLGVDASSGLEEAPGAKDPALVEAFVRRARDAYARALRWVA